jgi:hypothetical protein
VKDPEKVVLSTRGHKWTEIPFRILFKEGQDSKVGQMPLKDVFQNLVSINIKSKEHGYQFR